MILLQMANLPCMQLLDVEFSVDHLATENERARMFPVYSRVKGLWLVYLLVYYC